MPFAWVRPMTKILFVIPDPRHGSAATQLGLLARSLPTDQFTCQVCVLGGDGPLVRSLRAAGVPVEALGGRHAFDGKPLWRLRQRLQAFQPDVVHLWRPAALRAWAVISVGGKRPRPRVVFSGVRDWQRRGAGRLDRWLASLVDQIIVAGPAELDACVRAGLRADQLVIVPPGVARPEQSEGRGESSHHRPHVACVGPLEPHKGFYDAVWAFDMLRYLYNELQLHVIGTGSERTRLARFVSIIRAEGQVHWHADVADVGPWLRAADVVWVPSLADGGTHAALEAMAAGRPVVASRLAWLEEVVAEGETGLLVPPGDRMALARQTRRLLEDGDCRRQLGAAGRLRAERQFGADAMTGRFLELYANTRRAG